MNRRDFKKSIGGGIVAGSAMAFGSYEKLMAATPATPQAYDLVAVRGGEPDVMFDQAIESQVVPSKTTRTVFSRSAN